MRKTWVVLVPFVACALWFMVRGSNGQPPAKPADDEQAIRQAVAAYAEAFNKGDLAALETAAAGCEQALTVTDQAKFDLAFHLGIARAARNPVIETMFRSISVLTIE